MIYPVHQGGIQIDHVHNTALCSEIGERLVIALGQKPTTMPLHLMLLMSRLRDASPEHVNSIH
jgi:hypothetical protein